MARRNTAGAARRVVLLAGCVGLAPALAAGRAEARETDAGPGLGRAHRVLSTMRLEARTTLRFTFHGSSVVTTPEHPFAVAAQGWVRARDLKVGDRVLTATGTSTLDAVTLLGSATVFNLHVEDVPTFHVGSEGVLVHNTCQGVVRAGNLKGFKLAMAKIGPDTSAHVTGYWKDAISGKDHAHSVAAFRTKEGKLFFAKFDATGRDGVPVVSQTLARGEFDFIKVRNAATRGRAMDPSVEEALAPSKNPMLQAAMASGVTDAPLVELPLGTRGGYDGNTGLREDAPNDWFESPKRPPVLLPH